MQTNKEFTCLQCDGRGWNEYGSQICCGHFDKNGECCGVPYQEWYQKQCQHCNGCGCRVVMPKEFGND